MSTMSQLTLKREEKIQVGILFCRPVRQSLMIGNGTKKEKDGECRMRDGQDNGITLEHSFLLCNAPSHEHPAFREERKPCYLVLFSSYFEHGWELEHEKQKETTRLTGLSCSILDRTSRKTVKRE